MSAYRHERLRSAWKPNGREHLRRGEITPKPRRANVAHWRPETPAKNRATGHADRREQRQALVPAWQRNASPRGTVVVAPALVPNVRFRYAGAVPGFDTGS